MMSEMVFALSRAEGPFDDNHCFSTFLFAHLVHMSSTIEQKVINDGKNSKGGEGTPSNKIQHSVTSHVY